MKAITIFAVSLICMTACKTKYIAVPEYHYRDSVQIKHIRDSLFLHDSIYVSVSSRNDTVFKDTYKWRYAYRDRLVHDTVSVMKRDSVSVPCPIEKELTAWQSFRLRWFGWLVAALSAALAWNFRKVLLKIIKRLI